MLSDFKFAFRSLLKSPGFTTVAVITLALGIGAVTAVFSMLYALLLRSLPYPDAQRLVVPLSINKERGLEVAQITYADYQDWQQRGIFERLALINALRPSVDLTDEVGEPTAVEGIFVNESYFAVLGMTKPLLGRTFLTEEYAANHHPTCILSYSLWRKRYGGDPKIVGRNIRINGNVCPVVGVMPQGTLWPDDRDIVQPLPVPAQGDGIRLAERGSEFMLFQGVARLKPGVSLEQTNAMLAAAAQHAQRDYPRVRQGWTNRAVSLQGATVGRPLRVMLLTSMAAVFFVLAIAVINVASLLLARVITRQHEMQVRAALGAGSWQMTRHLLVEGMLLALLGGGLGLLLAGWAIDLVTVLNLPGIPDIQVDWGMLGFALSVSAITAVLCGVVPVTHALRRELNPSHSNPSVRNPGSAGGGRLLKGLIVAEVALSLMLLVGAGLLIRSFLAVQRIDPGLQTERLLTMKINAGPGRSDIIQTLSFYRDLVEHVQSAPGVMSASISSALPLGGGGIYIQGSFLPESNTGASASAEYPAMYNIVSPGFFNTMGIRRIVGRDFDSRDITDGAPVIIINETLARRIFPNESPLGKRLRSGIDGEKVYREIIGVVSDVRYRGREDELRGLVYVPHAQRAWPVMMLNVRTNGDPAAAIGLVRSHVRRNYPDLVLADLRTMTGILEQSTASRRSTTILLAILAGVALALAAIGIYGVLSYMVMQRVREVGLRMALGALTNSILKMVVGQGLRLILTGVTLGVIGALMLTHFMRSLLYEVSATDPPTFFAVSLFLTGVALAACYMPARRAAKVDPLVALRAE